MNKVFFYQIIMVINKLFCSLELAGYDPSEGRPNIKNWMELVRKETNPHYDDAHIIINKIVKANKSKL